MMPKMDGMETTQIIRELGYDHPIVAMTANAVTGSAERFMSNGFDGYISKPVDIRELNSSLNRLIRDKQPKEVVEAARLEMNRRKQATALRSNKPSALSDEMIEAVSYDIENAVGVLDDLLSKDGFNDADMMLYTTTVHGIKSALTNVNEKELSSIAFELEQLGTANKEDEIFSDTPPFVELLKTLLEKLRPKSTHDSDTSDTESDVDTVFLSEKLKEIKTACERIKKSEAKAALSALKQKTWPQEVSSILDEISENLLLGRFKIIIALIDKRG
jgi:CheY-like chemotaxis protein